MNRPKTSATVCTIPPGVPFLGSLAGGLLDRFGNGDPLGFARVTVFLPTRRAVRSLREELRLEAAARGRDALLLPEVHALGDVDEDELLLTLPRDAAGAEESDLPPAMGEIRRQVLLARLIERWSQDRHRAGDAFAGLGPAQAMALAAELAQLLDHLHTEESNLEGLDKLVPAQFSGHWQTTVEFLSIVSRHWPEILKAEGVIDPGARRNLLLRALARRWAQTPPDHPVIAAGSTGSIPATAELLAVIARLPKGLVLLPGLDTELDEEGWTQLDPPHPQYGLKHLLDRLGICRDEVSVWEGAGEPAPPQKARARLWSAVFRPAPATSQWAAIGPETVTGDAVAGLYRIDAKDSAEEAGIIACLLRRTLETPERTAALVTPDRNLARRVAAELRRWQIDIDDSAGQPLAGAQAGIILRCLLEAVETRFAPVALLSLLKHELCRLGMSSHEKHDALSVIERTALRGLAPAPGLAILANSLKRRAGQGDEDLTGARMLIERLEAAVAPLSRLAKSGSAPLEALAHALFEAANALTCADGEPPLWEREDGKAAKALLEELTAQQDGPDWSIGEFSAVITRCLQARPVHARHAGHPRLFIWGPLEARLQHTDVMILGGLNEGTWPAPPRPDAWLNRRMQSDLGLPDPERRIGQAAHDVAQLACAEEVYLIRSTRVEGAPQLPSRWLLRLDAVLRTADLGPAVLAPREDPAGIFKWLDRRAKRERIADPKPAPVAEARPTRLSVTAIETLVRDPYAIYAREVLRLRPLDMLEAEPGPGERGSLLHDTLRRFTERFADGLPADRSEALAALLEEGEAGLKRAIGPEWVHPAAHTFWRARFEAAAIWFVDWEYRHRASGATPLLWEAKGELFVDAGQGFTLTARADRIDRLEGGGHAILDYKSGRTPTDKEVGAGFAPQLPLEGAILAAGGFEGAPAGRAKELLYVMLGGGRRPGEARAITGGANSAEACIATALTGLKNLITQYHDPDTPFLSRPHVRFLGQRSDYDHLARVKEWSAGVEEASE